MNIIFYYVQMVQLCKMLIHFSLNLKKAKPDFYIAQVFIFAYLGSKQALTTSVTKSLMCPTLIYILNAT